MSRRNNHPWTLARKAFKKRRHECYLWQSANGFPDKSPECFDTKSFYELIYTEAEINVRSSMCSEYYNYGHEQIYLGNFGWCVPFIVRANLVLKLGGNRSDTLQVTKEHIKTQLLGFHR